MKLFDRNGKPVEVPDDQAQEALSSGNFAAPAGTQIPVRMNGVVGSVPIEKLLPALDGGATVVSQADYEKADLQARYGDVKHGALAAGTAALDAATLGLSNAAIGTIGGKGVRKTIRKSEEANPSATALGTGVGIVGPIIADVLSGGTATPVVAGAVARAGEKAAVRAGEKALAGAGERAAVEGGEAAVRDALTFSELFAAKGGKVSAAERDAWLRSAERRAPTRAEARAREDWLRHGQGTPVTLAEDLDAGLRGGVPAAERPIQIRPGDASLTFDRAGEDIVLPQMRPLERRAIARNELPEPGSREAQEWWLRGMEDSLPRAEGKAVEPFKIGKLGRERDIELAAEAEAPVFLRGRETITRRTQIPTQRAPFESRWVDPDAGLRLPLGEADEVIKIGARGPGRAVLDMGTGAVPGPAAVEDQLFKIGRRAAEEAPATGNPLADVARPLWPGIGEGAAKATPSAAEKAVVDAARAALESPAAVAKASAEVTGKGVVRQAVEGSLLGPQRLVSGGGQLVEDVVRGIIGTEAETALGRIAQKAVAGAARAGFEGGAYGVGQEVGHQFLQDDPELSGERLASAWFHGALLGGAFGGAMGTLGQGTREALTKALGRGGVAEHLMQKSGETMWHAAGPTLSMTAAANRYAGGAWKVGNLIRNDAIEILGRAPRSREELLELAPLIQKKHAAVLDAVMTRLDDSAAGGAPRIKAKQIDSELQAIRDGLVERAAPTGQLDAFRQRVRDATGAYDKLTGEMDPHVTVSFSQLRDFRISVDEMRKFPVAAGMEKAPDYALKDVRHWLEGHILTAADQVADKAGGTLLKDYKAAKEGYQAGLLVEKAAGRGRAAEGTNQYTSLTDKLMAVPGAMIGHAAAGPVGGFLAHVATAHASKIVRRHFDFVVSDSLAKLANVARGEHVLAAAQKSSERVEKRSEQGLRSVRKVLDGKEASEMPPVAGPKTFEERRDTLLNAAAQQQAVQDHLRSVTSPLDRAAPTVAQALQTASLRTLTYLLGVLPKPPEPPKSSLTPQLDLKSWSPSDQAKAKFNRQYDIAVRPETLLALTARGEVTADHIATLKVTNPKMLAKEQAKLQRELERLTKPVPVGIRSSTRLVLGVPQVDPSLSRMMQANYAPVSPAKSGLSKPFKLTDNTTLNRSRSKE